MGVGAAEPTLAGPRRIQAAVRSEQPPDPRGARAALERVLRSAPRRAPRGGHPGVGGAPARLSRRPLGSSVSEEPRRCGAAFRRLPRSPARPPAFRDLAWPRRRGGGRGGEAGAAAAGAERKWHARILQAEAAEDWGRRCRDSVGEKGESERGKRGARAPAGYREARAALRLRPPHLRAPTQRATGPGSGSSHRRRPRPPGGPSKSLDLGEDAALSGITSRAGRRPREPSQVTGTPTFSF